MLFALEQICFKGKTHLKRIPGISIISDKLLSLPVCKNINFKRDLREMFLQKYRTISVDTLNNDNDNAITDTK
jgi:hypothetical protein